MKIRGFDALTATLDLDPTDCLALADACGHALAAALRAALEACAVIAATDTLRDNRTPEREMLEDTRRVWGAFDVSGRGKLRLTKCPA